MSKFLSLLIVVAATACMFFLCGPATAADPTPLTEAQVRAIVRDEVKATVADAVRQGIADGLQQAVAAQRTAVSAAPVYASPVTYSDAACATPAAVSVGAYSSSSSVGACASTGAPVGRVGILGRFRARRAGGCGG